MNYYSYFSEIEETFIRRRGRNLLLSPLDWALIESWQQREVPLHIIIRGIETVFDTVDKQPARKRNVKSLLYCKEEIEAQYAEWLEMQTGKNGASDTPAPKTPEPVKNNDLEEAAKEKHQPEEAPKNALFSVETIETHLDNVLDQLRNFSGIANGELEKTVATVSARIEELRRRVTDAESIEDRLEKLDAQIDESLLASAESETLAALKAETEKNLSSYKARMEPDVFQRTVDLMLVKRLREQAELPRLSLFYL